MLHQLPLEILLNIYKYDFNILSHIRTLNKYLFQTVEFFCEFEFNKLIQNKNFVTHKTNSSSKFTKFFTSKHYEEWYHIIPQNYQQITIIITENFKEELRFYKAIAYSKEIITIIKLGTIQKFFKQPAAYPFEGPLITVYNCHFKQSINTCGIKRVHFVNCRLDKNIHFERNQYSYTNCEYYYSWRGSCFVYSNKNEILTNAEVVKRYKLFADYLRRINTKEQVKFDNWELL